MPSRPPLKQALDLHRGERKALREFAPFDRWEANSKHLYVGLPSMRSLVRKGLALEGPAGPFGPTFRLTDKGKEIAADLIGKYDDRTTPKPRVSVWLQRLQG